MKLEEKANEYSESAVGDGEHVLNEKGLKDFCVNEYSNGYRACILLLTEWLSANPKATNKQIIKHLEELK